jgi:hypothetical protein
MTPFQHKCFIYNYTSQKLMLWNCYVMNPSATYYSLFNCYTFKGLVGKYNTTEMYAVH